MTDGECVLCRGARAPVTSLAQRSRVTGVDAVADHHCAPAIERPSQSTLKVVCCHSGLQMDGF